MEAATVIRKNRDNADLAHGTPSTSRLGGPFPSSTPNVTRLGPYINTMLRCGVRCQKMRVQQTLQQTRSDMYNAGGLIIELIYILETFSAQEFPLLRVPQTNTVTLQNSDLRRKIPVLSTVDGCVNLVNTRGSFDN